MKILYIGDIMGQPGIKIVENVLPKIRKEYELDFVIAQAENVTEGKGLSIEDYKRLRKTGIDFFTGGNWSTYRDELHDYLNDPQQPVIRPANYTEGTPGRGYKTAKTAQGEVLVVSLIGDVVGRDANKEVDNPLQTIDKILEEYQDTKLAGIVVNLHGDYSSQKRVIGYYLDGHATLVVGDHWHVPTADAMILPKGTAHMTDVGMCGSLHSSLGVSLESIIPRWRDGLKTKNQLAQDPPYQFNAVLVESDPKTGLASSIKHLQVIE